MRKRFGEGKYLVHGGEKEQRRNRRKIFGEGKYLEKEKIWCTEDKKNGEGKYLEKENVTIAGHMNKETKKRTMKDRATEPMDHGGRLR